MTPRPSTTTTTRPPATTARLFFVDNLRVFLTVLVVLHHVAITYGNIPLWFYTEPAQDPTGGLLDLFVVLNQTFFMGLFFLLAGYFVPGAADRRGRRSFVRERLVRLGAPLLLFLLLLRPLAMAPAHADMLAADPELSYWMLYVFGIDPGPLWFVEVLLVMSLVYVVVRGLRERRAPVLEAGAARDASRPADSEPLHWFVPVVLFAAGLAVVTFVWRFAFPAPYWPVVGLPSPGYLPQYAALFTVGVFAYRRNWLMRLPNSAGWGGPAMAVAGLVALGAAVAVLGVDSLTPGGWQVLVQLLAETLFSMGVVVTLLVLFRRLCNRSNRFLGFLSDNAFAVYVLHALVLVALGLALSGWEASALAKFAGMAALAVPLCWVVAAAVRSFPGARRIL
ncbi:acyltransferase family protein [Nocardiopsis prasina]|uniref:acyltransferase family protein n=1 Tax=Nocardiopsis prasina TaxID=2015 RepID=UPI00034825A5|nr:acyltransferase [Nocardiopsis prasina]